MPVAAGGPARRDDVAELVDRIDDLADRIAELEEAAR